MWKPALFLITIVLVTPTGRAAFGHYVQHASSLFAVNSSYRDLAILAAAVVLLGLLLLIFCQSPKHTDALWILRRVQGQEPADASPNRTR
jgi:hypothetical protein